ncbi:MAG: ABC transporter permease [Sideroxydans sp. GWF2_59_14]|nr:MAG: ABC transporter permease [Sideroxydans sp. GWF2_59_14]
MNLLRLSLNLLRRDWRAGEWRVLLLALVLAVGSLATVGLFADRVRQALQQQAQSLIGADLRITSTRPFSPAYRKAAEARGLQVVQSRTFPSMVAHGEQVSLSEIQAVEKGYPLRGEIEIDDGSVHVAQAIPARGTVWADERLLRRLDVQAGDEVGIGARRFAVAAIVVKDIDQSIGFSSFAPRVQMNDADLASTGLLQQGSRLSYRLMIAGDAVQVKLLRTELEPGLSGNEKMEDVRDARPEIRTALERAEHFLGLAALTAAILAGAAMALAARRFVLRHLDGCAVMRCLGAQQGQVLWLFLYQFILLGVVAVLLGGLLGYATQAVLVESIAAMRNASLPQPGVLPLLKAAASGFALLLGFAFLPLLQLRRVSPLRVLRREMGSPEVSGWLIYGLAVAVLALLFLWHAGSLKLGLAVLGGLLAGLLVFGWLAWLLLHGLARNSFYFQSQWRHAFNNLARHGRSAAVQVVALSLGGMALLVLTLVRADLLEAWQGKLPPDTPNRFVVNIQSDQVQPVQDFFVQQSLPSPELQPMVRGRLVAINDRTVSGDSYPDPRARGLVEREFNLSYMEQMPGWNELVSGKWWGSCDTLLAKPADCGSGCQTASRELETSASLCRGGQDGAGELSVEEGIAKTLGIHMGDTLTYDVAGSSFTAKVTSLRKVQWDSMRVNFFVIATPELLQDFPASYLSSFYLPTDRVRAGDELSRAFPNILLIDTGAVIAQVRGIMDQIAQTVSAVFLFTLLTGLAVLYAALLATQDERSHEAAILRTLGADSRYLRRLHLTEFAVLGGLSGLFAAAGAVLLGWVLARFVLEIPYQANLSVWLIGVLGGMAVVMLAGWLATRKLLLRPPLRILAAD